MPKTPPKRALSAFAGAYAEGRYEREKGRLRTWLFAIAANHIKKTLRRRPSREVQVSDGSRGTGFFAGLPEDAELEEVWEAEWQRAVVQQCLSEVSGEFHDQTVAAFTLFVLQEWPAQRVADHLGMSRNAVYLAQVQDPQEDERYAPRDGNVASSRTSRHDWAGSGKTAAASR